MLSRMFLGCSCILVALSLAPQSVEAGSFPGDRHQLSRNVRWAQGGCRVVPVVSPRISPRRSPSRFVGNQIRYFCIDGVRKRRLPCGVIERWRAPHFKTVQRTIRIPGGFRNEIRYRNEFRCGVRVRIPYTIQVSLPDRCELRKQRVHVPGRWVQEKGRQCRAQRCHHGHKNRI